ncbi:MAG: amidohydrolase family protein [Pseudomonadota bacterium]
MTRQIIDAHHHLWDLQACDYPWLQAKGVKRFFGDPTPIQNDYQVDDFRNDVAPWQLLGSVHIQVGVAEGQAVDETRWLQLQSEQYGLPNAIVAYCELERDDLEAQLDAHQQSSKLRGARQIVGRAAAEDARTGSGALLANDHWKAGLTELGARGLRFDLQLVPDQLYDAARVMSDIPDLSVALCHAGSPWDQSEYGLAAWRDGLVALAAHPKSVCKLSGFTMFDPDWSDASIGRLIDTCLDVFGVDRCMFGSNFPVDKLHRSFLDIWSSYEKVVGDLSEQEQDKLFRGNAASFYSLGLSD